MKPARPHNKHKRVKLALALVSALAVALVGFSYLGRSSPGPLSAVHARVPELQGWQSCAQCHGGLFGDMRSACLECHEDVAAQIQETRGLHGSVRAARQESCALCHSEHHGADFRMVHRGSFAQVGIAKLEAWDHAPLGFTLEGKHLELGCAECHANADADVLPEGERRFLGLSQDCASCHEDPHQGQMSQSCASCHTQASFETIVPRGHERQLALVGGHAGLSCRECHAKDDAHALEAYRKARPARRNCASCHEDPHSEGFVAGNAKGRAKGASCAQCHQKEHTSFRDERLTIDAAQHAHSGFGLSAPHAELACAKCHDPVHADFAARYPGREQDSCQSCHEDPHGGQFDGSAHAAQSCRSCHARTHFSPHAFTSEKHGKTRMPLTGAHARAECSACHLEDAGVDGSGNAGAVRRFRGTAGACDDCHEDAHAGRFARALRELLNGERSPERATTSSPGSCGHCHTTENFAVAAGEGSERGFDHVRWTGFPIRGAHAAEGCEACHRRSDAPDAKRRSFGRCSEIFGEIRDAGRSCVPCHKDPHGGAFDRDKLPRAINGRTACARCHTEVSFRQLQGDFDHGLWTGFALTGRHAEAACSSCHEPRPGKPTHGIRSWGRAAGRACADCHEDPHRGQFAVLGRNDCSKCHSETHGFDELRFKHDLHSRFKLGASHRKLACAKCHASEEDAAGAFVRYKPLGRECSNCHQTRQRPFQRRGRR